MNARCRHPELRWGDLLDGKHHWGDGQAAFGALPINEISDGSTHPNVATFLNTLAALLKCMNRLADE